MSTLEERLSALEQLVREQAKRAAQDEDLAGITLGLRAANNLLQTAILAEHTSTLADQTRRLAELEAGVKTIIEMLGTLVGPGDPREGA